MQNKKSIEFHQISKNIYNPESIRVNPDSSKWPNSWKDVYIKVYDRFPIINLPAATKINISLSDTIMARKSSINKDSGYMDIQSLANILFYSIAEIDSHAMEIGRRAVSSAGARYPLESYVFIMKEISGLKTGLYHYRVDLHKLEYIYEFIPDKKFISQLYTYDWADNFVATIFVTAVFARNQVKYNERGYRYILLEAGAAGQMMQHVANAQNINTVIMGGTYDDKVEELLDIDGVSESLINTILLR